MMGTGQPDVVFYDKLRPPEQKALRSSGNWFLLLLF
jgi:hypothetical protein